jgi:hypothetical protein
MFLRQLFELGIESEMQLQPSVRSRGEDVIETS